MTDESSIVSGSALEPTPSGPSRWQRLREWVRPPAKPPPVRFNESSEELLVRLGTPRPEVVSDLLEAATAAFNEAAERAESAERRAATIQGAIAIAASLTLAGGSLLLDASKVPSHPWRTVIAVGFALAVLLFAIAAWRAFLVTWPRFMWASPAAADIPDYAGQDSSDAVQLRRTRDFLIAYGRDDSIARLKIQLLRQAVRWMLGALTVIAAVAVTVAAYSIERAAGSAHPKNGELRRTIERDGPDSLRAHPR
jgi:hypothetical protein